MSDMVCIVTGFDTYKYMKLEENFKTFNVVHSELNAGEGVSTEYTCHTQASDTVQFVIGTAQGEILVVSMRGEFILSVPECPG